MKSEIIDELDNQAEKADISSSHQYRLKMQDDTSGFRASKYKDSLLSNDYREEVAVEEGGLCPNNKFWKQTRLMTWKNYLVFKRNYKQVLFQLLVPVSICILLIFLQKVVDLYNSYFIEKNPLTRQLNNIGRCQIPEDCVTIGYGLIVYSY
jgi:hypothetical protein